MRNSGYSFSQVPVADIPRSVFNRSFGHKTAFDASFLVPIFVDEALPGDTFVLHGSAFARLATPVVPIMDNMVLEFFFFAVPNRLLWDNWQRFMGEQMEPGDSTDFLLPQIVAPATTGYSVGSLYDYFGIPVGKPGVAHSALPLRAYNFIYNEWFRDENLCTRRAESRGDGPDNYADYLPMRRGKRHDYFTSCLPWPQKGPGVELPIGSTAPVIPGGTTVPTFYSAANPGNGNGPMGVLREQIEVGVSRNIVSWPGNGSPTITPDSQLAWGETALVADLSQATAATINKLREAFQIQRLLERDARGGTRYTELLRSHFGVISPDARLQRPEYLGGGSIPVIFNPVAQNAPTGTYGDTPQGNLAAYALASGKGIGFTKSFTEHCTIIGLVSARADLSYQQGLNRMWSRRTRYDFYWPAFSHLGEQAVLRKEIYATGVPAEDDTVFGYQERWAEYRYYPSLITGKMRSNNASPADSLDVWHLAQEFTSAPVLGPTFIEENVPLPRVIAVTDEPHFIFDGHFSMKCVRPMPTYSVPGLIDHF